VDRRTSGVGEGSSESTSNEPLKLGGKESKNEDKVKQDSWQESVVTLYAYQS